MSISRIFSAFARIFHFKIAPQGVSGGGHPCTPGYCIDITIDHEKGVINPVPDIVIPKDSREIHIHWRLPSGQNRHSFHQDHIKLKDPADHHDDAFDQQGPNDPLTYHWRNKNPKAKVYQYEINVYDAHTGKVLNLDPAIVNQG